MKKFLYFLSFILVTTISAQNSKDAVLKVNGKPIAAKSIQKVDTTKVKIGEKVSKQKLDSTFDLTMYAVKEIYRRNPIVTLFFAIMVMIGMFKIFKNFGKTKE